MHIEAHLPQRRCVWALWCESRISHGTIYTGIIRQTGSFHFFFMFYIHLCFVVGLKSHYRKCTQQLAAFANPWNQSAKAVLTQILRVHSAHWAQSPQTQQLKALGLIQTRKIPRERTTCDTLKGLQMGPLSFQKYCMGAAGCGTHQTVGQWRRRYMNYKCT